MVNRNFALWKAVKCKNPKGGHAFVRWAISIDDAYKGNLLAEILAMPRKKPIAYDDAINIFADKKQESFKAGDHGVKPGQYSWYSYNFVRYISDLGFHVEITGDEIESFPVSEVRA
jgi:hypothetical protein